MSTEYYPRTSLIGGGAGALDQLASADLDTGDVALVTTANIFYVYHYDATSSAAESSPDVIAPDDIGEGSGRWLLVFSKETAVMEADFDATTFLYATDDDTPQPKTPAEVLAILSGEAVAAFDFNAQALTGVGTIGCGVITQSGTTLANTYQAKDATLTSIAALGTAANKIAYTTGVDTWAEAAITAGGRQLLAALTEVESTQLEAIGATTISAAQWGYLGACTAAGGALLDDANAAAQCTTLGLGTGSTVQFTKLKLGTASDYYHNDLVMYDLANNGLLSGMTIVSAADATGGIAFANGTSGDARYEGKIWYDHNLDQLNFNQNHTLALKFLGSQFALFYGGMGVADYMYAEGGVHVGGTSDPGTDNLVVDGALAVNATIDINNQLLVVMSNVEANNYGIVGAAVGAGNNNIAVYGSATGASSSNLHFLDAGGNYSDNTGHWIDAASTFDKKVLMHELTDDSIRSIYESLTNMKPYRFRVKSEIPVIGFSKEKEVDEVGILRPKPIFDTPDKAPERIGFILDDPGTPDALSMKDAKGNIIGHAPGVWAHYAMICIKKQKEIIENLQQEDDFLKSEIVRLEGLISKN